MTGSMPALARNFFRFFAFSYALSVFSALPGMAILTPLISLRPLPALS